MSRIIIFGCGGVGIKVMHKLLAEGDEVVCFTDNSETKWKTCCEGKRVIPPWKILQEQFDYVAIGIFKAADIIREQLQKMGINNERIIIPIEPDRIFPIKAKIPEEELLYIDMKEYSSRNTREYQKLMIQINDHEFLRKLDSLKESLVKNNIPREKVCVVSGAVLQVLGLRGSKEFDDIDIIMTDDLREVYGSGLVIVSDIAEMHTKDGYHIPDNEIIRNRAFHFVYNDLKFMHPQILLEHLKNKGGDEYELIKAAELWSIVEETGEFEHENI